MNYKEKLIALLNDKGLSQEQKEKLEQIFPELKESEDERIRKCVKYAVDKLFLKEKIICDVHKEDVLAWLEKQVEQRPQGKTALEAIKEEKVDNANKVEPKDYSSIDPHYFKTVDKVEPKFHEGEWIATSYGKVNQVITVDKDGDGYTLDDGVYFTDSWCDMYHLWDITKDAKDGDVLVDEDNNIGIYKKIEGICWHSYIYLGCDNRLRGFSIGGSHIQNNTKPATKEQRDTLMKAMADAGWEFDFEKKELKKISNALEECEIEQIEHGKYYYCIKDYYSGGCKRVSKGEVVQALRGMAMMALGVKANEYFIPVKCIIDNKPAWSEEDENK